MNDNHPNPFAGEKVPSMKRRCQEHDYTDRCIYMITMAVEGRRPLLGRLVGNVNAAAGSPEAVRVELTALGEAVSRNWNEIAIRHPEIELMAFQVMPDHIHGILFVHEKLKQPVGNIILGFKQGCNKDYKRLMGVQSVAVIQQPTGPEAMGKPTGQLSAGPSAAHRTGKIGEGREQGMLFEKGFHDRILLRERQLKRMIDYVHDNPRRLAMKRANPEFLSVKQGVRYGTQEYTAYGNQALLSAAVKLRVRCSRSIAPELLAREQERFLQAAKEGAVLVSPCISPGEKQIMRAAFTKGLRMIVLLENGMTLYSKPSGERFMACAEGRLLLLAPWEHHQERRTISRAQCEALNAMAWEISGGR